MTDKVKRFPLTLSSLGGKSVESQTGQSLSSMRVATPQTATKNAAEHGGRKISSPASYFQPLKPVEPIELRQTSPVRSVPLVPDSVRHAMVARLAKQGIKDDIVLRAMEAVQRHLFIEPGFSSQAYVDASLPIGHQQTISQPYIVARMIELLRNGRALQHVLEIGTGCGYQAAVLSLVAKEVFTIERLKPLHELAKNNLRPMRIPNIRLHYGDGMLGLPQVAPFDGIILAAAGMAVPRVLLEQMAIGGRLVAPVGESNQVLQLIERLGKSEWSSTTLESCHFVPLRSGVA